MIFTDNDLKRLKEYLADPYVAYMDSGASADDIRSLIARLEAAEKVCSIPKECNCSQECDWHSEALTNWRKAAGK